jgi:hypothetical protein
MKTFLALLISLILLPLNEVSSAIIYSESFVGTDPVAALNGSSPDVAENFAGGSSTATWIATSQYLNDGTVATTNSHSALLPVDVQSGYIYTLTGSVTTGSTASGWLSLGFTRGTSAIPQNGNHYGNGGTAWMLKHGSGSIQTAFEAQAGIQGAGTVNGTANFTIILDTSTPAWSIRWLLNGNQVRTETYTTNPDINYVGFGSSGMIGTISNFSLSAVAVPEPSRALLLLTSTFAITITGRRRSIRA